MQELLDSFIITVAFNPLEILRFVILRVHVSLHSSQDVLDGLVAALAK